MRDGKKRNFIFIVWVLNLAMSKISLPLNFSSPAPTIGWSAVVFTYPILCWVFYHSQKKNSADHFKKIRYIKILPYKSDKELITSIKKGFNHSFL